jgi:hypothetical protein
MVFANYGLKLVHTWKKSFKFVVILHFVNGLLAAIPGLFNAGRWLPEGCWRILAIPQKPHPGFV